MLGSKNNTTFHVTKDSILARTTEEEILEYYMQAPFQVGGRLFRNPYREDHNPTCSYFYGDDFAGVKDWQGWYSGGPFGLVMKIYGCNYKEALNHIVNDMRIGNRPVTNKRVTREKARAKEFRVKRREWTAEDLSFWGEFGISPKTLERFNVAPVQYVWIDGNLAYTHKQSDPCYVYHFIDYEYKLYFPFAKNRSRFWTNCRRLQGFQQLRPERPLCVITKSLKDVMTLDEYGINAVAPSSENGLIDRKIVEYLGERFELHILFDNDATGRTWGDANSKEYDIPAVYLPEDKAKDISDFRKAFGDVATRDQLSTLKFYKHGS